MTAFPPIILGSFAPSLADLSLPKMGNGLIVALTPSADNEELMRQLETNGWEVINAQHSMDIRHLAMRPDVRTVLLDICFGEESGFLTCVKLKHRYNDSLRVVLRGPNDRHLAKHAQFVGADGYVDTNTSIESLIEMLALN